MTLNSISTNKDETDHKQVEAYIQTKNSDRIDFTTSTCNDVISSEPTGDPIQSAMGDFGKWQLLVFITAFLVKFPVGWHQLSIIFTAPPASFECINSTLEKCSESCSVHEFDRSVFTETIITQWDLVCENAQWASVSQLIFMFGVLLGNVFFGTISDKFGRRIPLVIAVFIQMVSGISTAFVPWFWLYVVMRFITAVSTGGTMITSFVLLMEVVGIRYREITLVLYHIPINLGHLSLPLFAYYLRDWHMLQLAISLPSILLISYYWLVPESPRWLFTVGRVDESVAVLQKAAKRNGRPIEEIDTKLKAMKMSSPTSKASNGNIWDLFRTPNMRTKTLVLWFNWFVCGLDFYGVSQYVGQIEGDIFTNVAISAAVEVPGLLLCIYTMRRFGRRNTMVFANLFAGISMLIIAIIPNDAELAILILASCGITGMNMSFTAVYTFSGEIFPTVVRNIGLGSSSMLARFGTMLAPFVAGLAISSPIMPPIIFGLSSIAGAATVLLLPETYGTALPETLQDGEIFGKKVKATA